MQRWRIVCDGYTIHLVRFLTEDQARRLHADSDGKAASQIKQGVWTRLYREQHDRAGKTVSRQQVGTDRLLP